MYKVDWVYIASILGGTVRLQQFENKFRHSKQWRGEKCTSATLPTGGSDFDPQGGEAKQGFRRLTYGIDLAVNRLFAVKTADSFRGNWVLKDMTLRANNE
jgi:hypothetical protein